VPGGHLANLDSWIISPLVPREITVLSEEPNPLAPHEVFDRWFTSLG